MKLSGLILRVFCVTFFVAYATCLTANVTDHEDKDTERIVGGKEAWRGQFPFVVGLWRKNSVMPFCGGSLISDR